jgi:hypothetical protein
MLKLEFDNRGGCRHHHGSNRTNYQFPPLFEDFFCSTPHALLQSNNGSEWESGCFPYLCSRVSRESTVYRGKKLKTLLLLHLPHSVCTKSTTHTTTLCILKGKSCALRDIDVLSVYKREGFQGYWSTESRVLCSWSRVSYALGL